VSSSRIHFTHLIFCACWQNKSMEGTWMERLEPTDRERIKKMSEEAVKRQMEREGWNPEHLKGVPLADLKEALAEAWVKRRAKEEEQGAVGGEEQHGGEPDEAVEVEERNESLEIVRMKIELERKKLLWREKECRRKLTCREKNSR